ncbi:hypothetical protein SDC9_11294 [bioreactor metagenome]|uniref:Uncharacterized protein n=1 Tax=bioreactor metagenome TaxID=1076179 RepID=A0A644TFJ3_9ZZZZ
MPRCPVCGNTKSFGSSRVDPIAPSANGLISGMVGVFNSDDEILSINSLGANKTTINQAAEQPQAYFDLCLNCGSQQVEWSDSPV